MTGLFATFVILTVFKVGYSASPIAIASLARSHVGSDRWVSAAYFSVGGFNTNKSNLFVADVLRQEGVDVPHSHWWYSPIGADEWADPSSSYLSADACWELCSNTASGDVLAADGHVGIVTGRHRTTSTNAATSPPGLVTESDWGFRAGQNPTCWRYICS